MKCTFALAAALVLVPAAGLAQNSPGLTTRPVPTAAQWNGCFAAKADYNNPQIAGGIMVGTGSNDALTIAPGAGASSAISFGQSGTGGVTFGGMPLTVAALNDSGNATVGGTLSVTRATTLAATNVANGSLIASYGSGWSLFNMSKALLITSTSANPTIGFTDPTGSANCFAISDGGSSRLIMGIWRCMAGGASSGATPAEGGLLADSGRFGHNLSCRSRLRGGRVRRAPAAPEPEVRERREWTRGIRLNRSNEREGQMTDRAAIDALLKSAADRGDVPGVVAVAGTDAGIIYEGAFGKRDLSAPAVMTPDTVFWVASMTKAIVSAAAMQMVEQGKVGLDQNLGEILPELARPQVLEGWDDNGKPKLRAARNPITLRLLLTHTAGFSYEMWNADIGRYQEHAGLPGIISCQNKALETPVIAEPGTRWSTASTSTLPVSWWRN